MTNVAGTNFYILTGGAGAGKTTVLNELEALGHVCVKEVARKIIQEQFESGGNVHHQGDQVAFRDLMLARSIDDYQRMRDADHRNPVFFDRGIPELVAYCGMIGTKVPPDLSDAVSRFRYNACIFVFPPWPEIFAPDAERKQTLAEAVESYEALVAVIPSLGYRRVPRASPPERAQFILRATRQS